MSSNDSHGYSLADSMWPGSIILRQRGMVDIVSHGFARVDPTDSHADAIAGIDKITHRSRPGDMELDKDCLKEMEGKKHWIINEIRGETTDDPNSRLQIYVPATDKHCQVMVPCDETFPCGALSTVGYIELDDQVHSELMQCWNTYGRFTYTIDLTNLNLGGKGSAQFERRAQRTFHFDSQCQLVGPYSRPDITFRSTKFGASEWADSEVDGGPKSTQDRIEMFRKM